MTFLEFGDPIMTDSEAGSWVMLMDPDLENALYEASYRMVTLKPESRI